jgi:para-nitrobenzyl esterase
MKNLLAAMLLFGGFLAQADAADQLQVQVEGGRVRGVPGDGVIAWKGIPFAAPPVAGLRWRPPQPVQAWSGVRDATGYMPDCAQQPFPGDAAPLGVATAEDCLGLNVWKPARAGNTSPAPVLVWIYGGGFVNGGSSPAVYDGSAFARDGVVMVSFNYRVGRLGFFAHPALSAEARKLDEPLGNYGYLDQLAALRWVKANIAAFGGDPNNVTVMGESAGGASVLQWLVSPQAKGLFQRAIVLSGGGRGRLLPSRELDQVNVAGMASAEAVGLGFANTHAISGESPQTLAALRALPVERIVDGLHMGNSGAAAAGNTYVGGPIRDRVIVDDTTQQAMQAGRWAKLPVLIGATSDDLGFATAKDKAELFALFGADAEAARAHYDADGQGAFAAVSWQVGMDRMMIEPARFFADQAATQGIPAWLYRFGYVATSQRGQWPGAPHASELPYVFATLQARYGEQLSAADLEAATRLRAYVLGFVRDGKPQAKTLPNWPGNVPGSGKVMLFEADAAHFDNDPRKTGLDLVERSRR